jgi:glyoxylase-like metal-dependent hydrolase (beta-lactamase superfamily II)
VAGETKAQQQVPLRDRDTALGEIDRIFLTHWHGDHTGLASDIQEASGAGVYVHRMDAPLVAGETDAWEELEAAQHRYFDHWGMPEAKQAELLETMESQTYLENPPEVTPIEDGDTFSINGQELKAVHRPGHAAGLCVYEMTVDDRREVFTGDALLPKYTPNVGGADIRVERPLAKYLETLSEIADAAYDRAWPGHRDPIEDPTARAEEIFRHHEERSWRVLDALRRLGPCDIWTVSDELFGHLESIHILHGPGESYAHIEHLQAAGLVVQDGREYSLADGVEAELEEHDEERWPLATES